MEMRTMGLTGVRVSAVGLGTNQFGRRVDETGVSAVLDKAVELGVNFIDTAEMYSDGLSEELLGKALKGHRHQFVIATKTGGASEPLGRLSRRQMLSRLEASLKRLGTDHVDLYYLHFPDPGTPLDESIRALDDMVRSGKVVYPAISNHPAWQVAEAMGICDVHNYAKPVVVQDEYNLLVRKPETEMVPACRHFGLSLVPYSPLAGGFLTGKYRRGRPTPAGVRGSNNKRFEQTWLTEAHFEALERFEKFAQQRGHTIGALAMSWLLAQPLVCSVIAGVTSPDQLEANVRMAEWKLEPDDLHGL
jgi:aryl-alcohol dehydrogenase-like predicted oxidoreductase